MTVGTQAAPNSLARARLACKFGAVSWTVRSTRTGDKDAVLQVVRAAFSGPRRHGKVEVGIVARTWELGASPRGLDLVAVIDDMVVGHALGAEGRLDGTPALAVAPLCVSPSRQRMGIGCSLMTELLHRADSGGWPLVLVLGDPLYYQRFNFEPSGPLGIYYRPVGYGDPHFQVRRLLRFEPSLRGEFTYCWESPGLEEDVNRQKPPHDPSEI